MTGFRNKIALAILIKHWLFAGVAAVRVNAVYLTH
jgi:hypothetical protein